MSDRVSEIPPDLVARARDGERAALEALVEAVYPRVRRWALVRTGDAADADDLTQDVLVRMIRRIDSYQGDAELGTWLYAITRNAAIDRARRGRRDERLREDPRAGTELVSASSDDPQKTLERNELSDVIRVFFEDLPERQREAFDLVELQGMTAAEAGRLLEIEPVSVRANLFKARRRLRERILAAHPEVAEDVR